MKSARYDIVAKAPPNTTEATLGLMVQSLLATEFRLTTHEDRRPLDAFALVVAKGGRKDTTTQAGSGPVMIGCSFQRRTIWIGRWWISLNFPAATN